MKRMTFAVWGMMLCGLLLVTGCSPSEKELEQEEAISSASPMMPADAQQSMLANMMQSNYVSVSADELAALGPKNDLPAEWVFPGAFSAQVLRPNRFKGYEGIEEANRFFVNNPALVPNWAEYQNMDLVQISKGISFVALKDPASGEELQQRYPMNTFSFYIRQSTPIEPERLKAMGLPFPDEKISEQTIGEYKVRSAEQTVTVPLDNTGKQTAQVEGMTFAVYQPDEMSAVMVCGPKEDVEKFFTAGEADNRGALAQRLARLDTANADFAYLFDYQNQLKQAIQLPFGQGIAEAFLTNATSVSVLINAIAADETPAITIRATTAAPEGAAALETAFGSGLMSLAQMGDNLPEGAQIPEETKQMYARLTEVIKKVSIEKTDSAVTVFLNKTPELASFVADMMKTANQAYEQASKGQKYQQAAQQLQVIGRMMSNDYYAKNNAFPPMAICAADGTPLLSWRVALLPSFGPDGEKLFAQFKLDEPWDSENNIKLLDKMPMIYRSPFTPEEMTKTTFRVFNSPDTPFGKSASALKLADIPNPGKTFMVVSVVPEKAVEWTKPDVLAYEPEKIGETFGEIVLAAPVMGELFGAPLDGKEESIKAVCDWILGNGEPQEAAENTAPAPVETPADVPAPAESAAPAENAAPAKNAAETPAP